MILEYPLMAVLETLKEWKVAITSVGQEYKSTESWHDYNKNGKLRCFNCNTYRHMVKDCWKLKKKDKQGNVINVTKWST